MLGRAVALLRALSDVRAEDATTTRLAQAVGLARPTVHRLLGQLHGEGLVDRDESTGRWALGPELYVLGAAAQRRYDVTEVARPHVERLAAETGESAFLSARRGDEVVVLLREDGSFPLRSHVLHEGLRLPLGVASAGIVLLAYLSARDTAAYLDRVDLVPAHGPAHAPAPLRARLRAAREHGWALNPGLLVEDSWGMAAAVFAADGSPAWALSLTGVERRFGPDRQPELGRLLLREAHALTRSLSRRG